MPHPNRPDPFDTSVSASLRRAFRRARANLTQRLDDVFDRAIARDHEDVALLRLRTDEASQAVQALLARLRRR